MGGCASKTSADPGTVTVDEYQLEPVVLPVGSMASLPEPVHPEAGDIATEEIVWRKDAPPTATSAVPASSGFVVPFNTVAGTKVPLGPVSPAASVPTSSPDASAATVDESAPVAGASPPVPEPEAGFAKPLVSAAPAGQVEAGAPEAISSGVAAVASAELSLAAPAQVTEQQAVSSATASADSATERPKALFSGTLQKRGKWQGFHPKRLVLYPTELVISPLETEPASKKEKRIDITGLRDPQNSVRPILHSTLPPYQFEVVTAGKEWFFAATTDLERERWVDQLRAAVAVFAPPRSPPVAPKPPAADPPPPAVVAGAPAEVERVAVDAAPAAAPARAASASFAVAVPPAAAVASPTPPPPPPPPPAPQPPPPSAAPAATDTSDAAGRDRVPTVGDRLQELERARAAAADALRESFPQGPPSKEGLLTKQGGTWQSWRRRWFVLRDNVVLYYDPDEKREGEELGKFSLDGTSPDGVRIGKPGTDHLLEVDTVGSAGARTYYLVAKNDAERDEWIRVLRASIVYHRALAERRSQTAASALGTAGPAAAAAAAAAAAVPPALDTGRVASVYSAVAAAPAAVAPAPSAPVVHAPSPLRGASLSRPASVARQAAVAAAATAAATAIVKNPPTRVGLLSKQGGVWKTWHERRFVLKDNELRYYRPDDDGAEELGVIPLQGIDPAAVVPGTANLHQLDVPCVANSRTYYLCAKSDRERDEWIEAIRDSIRYYAARQP